MSFSVSTLHRCALSCLLPMNESVKQVFKYWNEQAVCLSVCLLQHVQFKALVCSFTFPYLSPKERAFCKTGLRSELE